MGSDLNGSIALLRALMEAPGRMLTRDELCSKLTLSTDALDQLVASINATDALLEQDADGVALRVEADLLDEEYIFKNTHGHGRVELRECSASTNTEMLDNAENLASGDVLIAEIQSAGRGRRGSSWLSGIGQGLTLSMAWRFASLRQIQGLAVAVGVSAAEAFGTLGKPGISVKWPNDLYIGDLKLGGILIESVPVHGGIAAVIGIGVNVYMAASGERLPISSLEKHVRLGLRNQAAVVLIDALRGCCSAFGQSGLESFMDGFEQRNYLSGRKVRVAAEDGEHSGTVCGMDAQGNLLLSGASGTEAVNVGHVELL